MLRAWKHLYVTLVLSMHSRDSLWVVADRRLSYGKARPPKDDAVKVMNLETTDGVGVLAYAGLGATPKGTQPSDWMSAVLRGRANLSFEQALGVLSQSANRELPRVLRTMPGRAHFIVVPAFIRHVGSRLYSIDNAIDDAGRHAYRFTRWQRTTEPDGPSIRTALAGSGAIHLQARRADWQRPLLRLIKANDHGQISDHRTADELARLNYETHQAVRDGTVGPRSIVVWRRRPDNRRQLPGGGHQFYTGNQRDRESTALPSISNGMDVRSLVNVLMSRYLARVAEQGDGASFFEADVDDLNRQLGALPWSPDERLQ